MQHGLVTVILDSDAHSMLLIFFTITIIVVTVKGSKSTFRGFLVIAHVPGEDHMLLGTFTPQNGSQQTLNCSFTGASNEMESTIAHNNSAKIDFQSITTKWKAPSGKDGMVDFRWVCIFNITLKLKPFWSETCWS